MATLNNVCLKTGTNILFCCYTQYEIVKFSVVCETILISSQRGLFKDVAY